MVRHYEELTPTRISQLRQQFNGAIQAPGAFWHQHRDARFATLIWLSEVCVPSPFWVVKPDHRA